MRYAFMLFSLAFFVPANGQDTIRTFILGDTAVHLVVHTTGRSGPLFFNMHDDEHTSVDAARLILGQSGGVLYELSHTGKRNIEFHLDSVHYEFDPNRIYSDTGVWRELRRVFLRDSLVAADSMHTLHLRWLQTCTELWMRAGTETKQALIPQFAALLDRTRIPQVLAPYTRTSRDTLAFNQVRGFADSLIAIMGIDHRPLVVALHNNQELGYSMASYRVDSIYEREALAVYIGYHPDFDDFYFVTDRRIFETLQPNQYHLVLQDNTHMTDDGSLSVYCGMRGIPYINVEAQHGHTEDQRRMLELVTDRVILPLRKRE